MDGGSDRQAHEDQWWLSSAGRAEGPYSAPYVLAALKSGTLPSTALACPVGGSEWKRVLEWPAFAHSVPEPSVPATFAPLTHDSPLTNSHLPAFANAICVYGIVVSPVLWMLQNLSCCVTGLPFKEESDALTTYFLTETFFTLLSLLFTVVIAIGAVRLRAGRRSGRSLLIGGIWTSLTVGLLRLAALATVFVLAKPEDSTESTTAGLLIEFVALALGLAELAFMIVALIWLHRSGRHLPLSPT